MNDKLRRAASNAVWAACRLLPVKGNKVVFSSFGGKGFGDNPKAVAQALLESGEDLDLVWLTRDPGISLPDGIRPCPFGTPQAAMELSTARVWVDNSRGGAHYKRKNQRYLQTWHGFALKKIEAAAQEQLPEHYVNQCKKDSGFTDLMVSNSDFMTRVYQRDFWYSGEVAKFGSPRNDIFFRDNAGLKDGIRRFFGLPEDRKLLLYAPTFRADGAGLDCYALDCGSALAACRERFGGEWSALIRLHPNVAAQSVGLFPYDGTRIVNATVYPDMQELLAGVDLLVTDYSSSMFDYALSGKPCIQFALDIEEYQKDRDFYFPIDGLPFPLARSGGELTAAIRNYDAETCRAKWQKFYDDNGFFEDGRAAQRCAEWILAWVKG